MKRKTWYSISGLDAMPLSLKNLLLSLVYKPRILDPKITIECPYGKTEQIHKMTTKNGPR